MAAPFFVTVPLILAKERTPVQGAEDREAGAALDMRARGFLEHGTQGREEGRG